MQCCVEIGLSVVDILVPLSETSGGCLSLRFGSLVVGHRALVATRKPILR